MPSVRLALAVAVVLAACAAEEPSAAPPVPSELPAGTVLLVGGDDLLWDDPDVTATAVDGVVTFEVVCDGRIAHNVVVEGIEDEAVQAQCAGRTTGTGSVELDPGTYVHYCALPGHRAAGMEGLLVVTG